jgi:hypothetical protein
MNLKNILTVLISALFIACSGPQILTAEENANASTIRSKVETKNFVFQAQSASPQGGRFIQLTSPYDVRIKNDTLVTFLPYFGRAFVAPINPAEGGIRFNSTSFDYTVENRKKGGWNVLITPQDARDVRLLQFIITETGNATLQVLSNNRQPITFNGFIEKNAG